MKKNPDLATSLFAGAAAGMVVDITLFPLDTLKTRLQSKEGFFKTGGFRNVYKGILPVIMGSAPTSAIFFMTYNTLLNSLQPNGLWEPANQVVAASIAEFVAASLRVPIEVVKQRKQIALFHTTALSLVKNTLKEEGVRGLYRGFASTLSREIPFAVIQYPTWEYLKKVTDAKESWQIGLCGAAAGAIAATLTTPMDVMKTRVMLADLHLVQKHDSHFGLHIYLFKDILRENGVQGFFAGIVPRVLWITIGGFIYFGVYGKAVSLINDIT